ncbi:DUF4396 domain-containing protein [Endobacter medicaginis]|uniref:DUF4396 domain-containing protein n=2 Tax=Endobacter medicaginis TaxID=1181271 RepID=A0A850NQ51_9PROT|nr:DUF4396 domain-containing protein [Endobacter medicaginis]NVN29108.1 DUF4396 domain-containing protein [Endobacter medicaginis]
MDWLHGLAIGFLALGCVCAVGLAVDVSRRPQPMAIMNVVWPVCALFGGLWVCWLYGRSRAPVGGHGSHHHHHQDGPKTGAAFALSVANDTLHCGAGCTLGDIIAEWLVFAVPAVAVAFGWGSLFGDRIFATWVVDFIFAYAFGVVFQYFAIAPMRGLSFGPGLWAAIKADTLSLIAWQIGMYGCMAVARFRVFPALGLSLHTDSVEFWFVMQCAMTCGYITSYPMNWFLVRLGIKDGM